MGTNPSKYTNISIPPLKNSGNGNSYFCVAFTSKKKIHVIHASPEVEDIFHRAVGDLGDQYHHHCRKHKNNGILHLTLPRSDDIMQALFAIKVLEDLHEIGYELVTAAILDVQVAALTWYFKKVREKSPRGPVVAVTTSGSDRMYIVNANADVEDAVRAAINEAWPFGVQIEVTEGEHNQIQYFKLTGAPWLGNRMILELIRQILGKLGVINWKLVARGNFNNSSDVLFFAEDPNYSPAIIDLGKCLL